MKKFMSIRQQFISSVMCMVSVIFGVMLVAVLGMTVNIANENFKTTETNIQKALIARGNVLVGNNSRALRGMVEDNAFVAIQELVSVTVESDADIVRGIFMDSESRPWVVATKMNLHYGLAMYDSLTDSVDVWAASLTGDTVALKSFNDTTLAPSGSEMWEFAAAVLDEYGDVLGCIRYTFSVASLHAALEIAREDAIQSRNNMILILLSLLLLALVSCFFLIRSMAAHITNPLASLSRSVQVIAEGNYNIEVVPESHDEIGELAKVFDHMRKTIKSYTENLQEIIDEKMHQVKDILNNIDQGLFTVNFDGTVNDEYSACTNKVLKVDDVSVHTVYDLLRLEPKARVSFDNWVNLVKERHADRRWKKLERLAPVHEMVLAGDTADDPLQYVSVSYQKIYDKNAQMSKLMILVQDETEKRLKERQIKEERLYHESEMKILLGVANTAEDELVEFLDDLRQHLNRVKDVLACALMSAQSHSNVQCLDMQNLDEIRRDIHTIKGNSGSYGFDQLSEYAHQFETALENLTLPIREMPIPILEDLVRCIEKMLIEFEKVLEKKFLIYGNETTVCIRIPESRVQEILSLSAAVHAAFPQEEMMTTLYNEVQKMSWLPLQMLTRKYQKMVKKMSRKRNKKITFVCLDEKHLFPSDFLFNIDKILIHLIKNAVAHGIQTNEECSEQGISEGCISVSAELRAHEKVITVSDNGRGIDFDKVVEWSIKDGSFSMQDIEAMSEIERQMLLFQMGFTTAESATELSGRGVGLPVVLHVVEKLNGTIDIQSKPGNGTVFTITIPV